MPQHQEHNEHGEWKDDFRETILFRLQHRDDCPIWKWSRESIAGNSVVQVIELRDDYHAVGDMENAVASRRSLFGIFVVQKWARYRQRDDSKRLAVLIGMGLQFPEVALERERMWRRGRRHSKVGLDLLALSAVETAIVRARRV